MHSHSATHQEIQAIGIRKVELALASDAGDGAIATLTVPYG